MITNRTNMIGRMNAKGEGAIKDDGFKFDSAKDQKELLGNKDLGTFLNELADPNYVDPAKIRKVGSNELGKDAFLKLMLAQMQNQDPTNPLKSHEMSAQLAQFTSLEQLQNMNTNIEKLVAAETPDDKTQALSMIGKVISADSSFVAHTEGVKSHDIKFDLSEDAKDVDVSIKDAEGNVVRTYEFHNLKKGENSIAWNARDDEGFEARPGDFKVFIKAKDDKGTTVTARTEIAGKITGINFSPQGPVLMVGKQTVRMSDVRTILDGSAMQDQGKKSNDITKLDVQKSVKPGDNKEGYKPKGNLEDVAMQKSLKQKLEKVR